MLSKEARLKALDFESKTNKRIADHLKPLLDETVTQFNKAAPGAEREEAAYVWRAIRRLYKDYHTSAQNIARDAELIRGAKDE